MPRTFGDSIIHQSHFDFAAHIDEPLPSHGGRGQTDQETKIGELIAENLVDDGATLQMGMHFTRCLIDTLDCSQNEFLEFCLNSI